MAQPIVEAIRAYSMASVTGASPSDALALAERCIRVSAKALGVHVSATSCSFIIIAVSIAGRSRNCWNRRQAAISRGIQQAMGTVAIKNHSACAFTAFSVQLISSPAHSPFLNSTQNLRVIAKYYERLNMSRCTELLMLSADEIESHLSTMVQQGQLYCRIDRPAGRLVFQRDQTANELCNNHGAQVKQLVNLISTTTHAISKAQMVYTAASTSRRR